MKKINAEDYLNEVRGGGREEKKSNELNIVSIALIISAVMLFYFNSCLAQVQVYKSDLVELYGEETAEVMYADLRTHTRFNLEDAAIGSLTTAVSGFFAGYWYEARAYGYTYPGTSGAYRDWLMQNTSGDYLFKTFHANKIGRSIDYTADRYGWNKLRRYFGDTWLGKAGAVLTFNFVKNTSREIGLMTAKHGKPFYTYNILLSGLINWDLDKVFEIIFGG